MAFNSDEIKLEPIQLPYKATDSWLAVEYPEDLSDILHNTISFVLNFPDTFDSTQFQCGIIIDDWTESIPNKSELTGVTVHYNQPNAAPPQTLLLAIAPEEKGSWSWNTLIAILDDTLERAKLRAVEPDLIDSTNNAIMLPALISEFTADQSNISLDLTLNINAVASQVTNYTTNLKQEHAIRIQSN